MLATTIADLRVLSDSAPDAPKWWLGDWANEGERLFGVSIEEAAEVGNKAALEIDPDIYRGSLELPVAIEADSTSLRLPEGVTREEWDRLGGFLVRVHDEVEPGRLTRKATFKIGQMYPSDDLISEWLATIAMAANDLIAVHVLMNETEDDSVRWYFFRAAAGHFFEVGKHLDETSNVPEVKAFVASLPQPAREAYGNVLEVFRTHSAQISKLRQSAFHYPSMMNPEKPDVLRVSRPLPAILDKAADVESQVRLGRLKDARFVFADDLSLRLAIRSVGTLKNLIKLQDAIQHGVQEFMWFMNPALNEHTVRRQRAGADVTFER